jgi:hypothetical protein
LISGLLWAVFFTGFTAGPSVLTSHDTGRVSFSLRRVNVVRVAKRALVAFVAGAFVGGGIAVVFGRLGLTASRDAGTDGRPSWLEEDEPVLRHGAANHFLGPLAIGGWLFLTDRRLYFDPHRVLQFAKPKDWALESIEVAAPCRTLGLVPNGLRLTLRSGRVERFAVGFKDRAGWVVDLESEGHAPT